MLEVKEPDREYLPRNPWWWSVSLLGAWPVKIKPKEPK